MQTFLLDDCQKAVEASTIFEKTNTELKRLYLLENIEKFNKMVKDVSGNAGTFGTGYPFYGLDSNLEGQLPIIREQLRYNQELLKDIKKSNQMTWYCAKCLQERGESFPDLKQICRPCPKVPNDLKPRKVINRLPDIDMWLVTPRKDIEQAKYELLSLFSDFMFYSSDINPMKTMNDVVEISNDILNEKMPNKMLPLDTHIIDKETLMELIGQVPYVLEESVGEGDYAAYLPIHPQSYRKKWQYDNEAYNFIYDYLSAFTPFNCDSDIMDVLEESREQVTNYFSNAELFQFLYLSATEANRRRFQEKSLKRIFYERMDTWRKK